MQTIAWTRRFTLMLGLNALVFAADPAVARNSTRRDVESYAIAACLGQQPSPFLKDQGDGWASNIVQRSDVNLPLFRKLDTTVKAEVARGHMATVIVDSPPMTVKRLPIQYCAEIIDSPNVSHAIDDTLRGLARRQRR